MNIYIMCGTEKGNGLMKFKHEIFEISKTII